MRYGWREEMAGRNRLYVFLEHYVRVVLALSPPPARCDQNKGTTPESKITVNFDAAFQYRKAAPPRPWSGSCW